jgi:hypothetical protein
MSDATGPSTAPCCCAWGAAVGGLKGDEWPEFECADCPRHLQGFGPVPDRCKRHATAAKPCDPKITHEG